MARPRQKNIVERLTGAGEEAIQRIGGAPGADKVLAAFGSLPKRVDELQRSVRGLEKLEKRLGTIEKRLDKLEGKGSSASRKTSAKRKTAARKPSSSS
jgi:DNA repair ATPase RecN